MPQITYPDKAIGDLYRAVEANEVKAVVNAKMDRPNGLVSGGAITIGSHGGAGTNNDIKVTAGSYFISPDFYNFTETPNTAPWLDVALCAGGFSRYVEIVGTTTGITRRDGTPSAIPSHPTLAANEISIGWILVGDSVFEETASGGGASIISDNEFVLNKTWSSSNISKNLHTYRSIEFIATEEQDINSPIIQGITATTGELALFTAQLIPSENGEYFYQSGAGWIKTAAWFDYRANEAYYNESLFLRNTAFYALKGTEVGSLYVMNVDEPSYAFSKIGSTGGGGLETFFENINVSAGIATLDCQEKAFPRFLINSLDSSPLELVIDNTFGVIELSLVIDIPSPNSDKGLITLPAFCYPTTYQINDNARYYSVKMTKYLGLLFCDFQPLSEVSLKQNIPQVKSASFVAQNDNNYVTNATATVTDPTPVNGKGYDVLVLTGTVTVGGTPYSTAGTYIRRRYVSGSWVNYIGGGGTTELSVINRDLDSLEIDSSTGVGTGAVIESATTSLAGLQSAADKTKLNLYPATATNNKYLKGNGTSWVEVDTDLAGIPTSTATASTPTFFDASKNLISATAGLLGTFWATFTGKSTPVNADTIVIGDSASSFSLVKTTLTEFKAFLKTYFDTFYPTKINNSQNTAVLFWENGIGEDLAGFYYDRTNKILNLKGTLPTIRFKNADDTYASTDRTLTANSYKIRNQVLQAGGTGKCLTFNGTNQYATGNSTGFPSGGSSFSVSFWFKTTGSINADIVNWGTYTNNYFAILIDNTGRLGVSVLGGATTYISGTFRDGGWHHLVLSYTSGSFTPYVDNILKSTIFSTANVTNSAITIGRGGTYGGTTYFGGSIDQFLIYNTTLSAGNVSTLYNSRSGTYAIPLTANLVRRWEFEENTGSTSTDLVGSYVLTLFNSVTWATGLVPSAGSLQEAILIEAYDGESNGEKGIIKFGEFNGRTIIQGAFVRFLIGTYFPLWYSNSRLLYLDSDNDGTFTPTAKVNVGASTALLAGFRFVAGVLNTSSINLGDFVHNLAQRTYFKRKGDTTANSLWLADSDVHFTQTDTKTVANTATATSLIGTLVTGQTLTFPADFWVAGKMEEIEIEGILSNVITDTLLIDVTLGGTNISTSSANTLGAAYTNTRFKLTLKIKCETVGASGTFRVTGEFRYTTALGIESVWAMTKVGTTTINTTTTLALDVKATWGAASASNTISSYNSKGLILN